MSRQSALLAVKWLAEKILHSPSSTRTAASKLRVLDATLFDRPDGGLTFKPPTYIERHIPTAGYFNPMECSDQDSIYPMMIPSAEEFAEYVGNRGVDNETNVVLYDTHDKWGFYTAPRVWWMFRLFGHNNVNILHGGLKSWMLAGHPVTDEEPSVAPVKFETSLNRSLLKTFEEVTDNIDKNKFQLVDARSSERFQGEVDEAEVSGRPGLKSGCIPHSSNIFFTKIYNEDGTMKDETGLRQLFTEAGVKLDSPLAMTCGSALTACVLNLAAHEIGKSDVAVYDGSWTEFAQRGPSLVHVGRSSKKA